MTQKKKSEPRRPRGGSTGTRPSPSGKRRPASSPRRRRDKETSNPGILDHKGLRRPPPAAAWSRFQKPPTRPTPIAPKPPPPPQIVDAGEAGGHRGVRRRDRDRRESRASCSGAWARRMTRRGSRRAAAWGGCSRAAPRSARARTTRLEALLESDDPGGGRPRGRTHAVERARAARSRRAGGSFRSSRGAKQVSLTRKSKPLSEAPWGVRRPLAGRSVRGGATSGAMFDPFAERDPFASPRRPRLEILVVGAGPPWWRSSEGAACARSAARGAEAAGEGSLARRARGPRSPPARSSTRRRRARSTRTTTRRACTCVEPSTFPSSASADPNEETSILSKSALPFDGRGVDSAWSLSARSRRGTKTRRRDFKRRGGAPRPAKMSQSWEDERPAREKLHGRDTRGVPGARRLARGGGAGD